MRRRRRISKIDFAFPALIAMVAIPVVIGEWIAHLPREEKLILCAGLLALPGL